MVKKKVLFDFILNLIASVLPTLALQLVVYPLVARNDIGDVYGSMVTIVSLLLLVSNTLGNVLNNVRLLENEHLNKKTGDFNFIIMIESVVGFLIILVTSIAVYGLTTYHLVLTLATGAIILLYAYYNVVYRISLNYKMIVVVNLCQGIGYLIGYIFYSLTGYWEWIYLVGYGIALFMVTLRSPLVREGFQKTEAFVPLVKKTGLLLASAILFSMLNYADKLLLYPLLGAEAVSIYYIASIFGKIVSMVVSPLNSVILSYLSKMKRLSKKSNRIIVLTPIIIAALGYVVCLGVSDIALRIIYPAQAADSKIYMPITSAIAMMSMLISFYYPFVLKYCNMAWQVFIDGISLVIYILLGVALFYRWGLMGFCVGVLIANTVKVIIMLCIYCKSVFKDKNENDESIDK